MLFPVSLTSVLATTLVVSLQSLVLAQEQSPVWEYQTFFFGWSPAVTNSSFDRCGSVGLERYPNPDAVSNPVGPYTFTALRAGQAPYRIDIGNDNPHSWTVNLNAGGPYLFSMEDSRGASGGVVTAYTVRERSLSCGSSGETPQTLGFELLTTSRSQCDTLSFRVTGGSPPYKLIVNPAGATPKPVLYSDDVFSYVLDVKSGVHVMFVVEDSSGKGAVGDLFTVGPSGNSACLQLAATVAPGAVQTTYQGVTGTGSRSGTRTSGSTASPSNSGSATPGSTAPSKPLNMAVIIGGAVGGFVLITASLILLLVMRRRRDPSKIKHPPNHFGSPMTGPGAFETGVGNISRPAIGSWNLSEPQYTAVATQAYNPQQPGPPHNPRYSGVTEPLIQPPYLSHPVSNVSSPLPIGMPLLPGSNNYTHGTQVPNHVGWTAGGENFSSWRQGDQEVIQQPFRAPDQGQQYAYPPDAQPPEYSVSGTSDSRSTRPYGSENNSSPKTRYLGPAFSNPTQRDFATPGATGSSNPSTMRYSRSTDTTSRATSSAGTPSDYDPSKALLLHQATSSAPTREKASPQEAMKPKKAW